MKFIIGHKKPPKNLFQFHTLTVHKTSSKLSEPKKKKNVQVTSPTNCMTIGKITILLRFDGHQQSELFIQNIFINLTSYLYIDFIVFVSWCVCVCLCV